MLSKSGQALYQRAQVVLVNAAAQMREILEDLRAAQAGIEGKFTGQVADQLFDLG